MKKILILVCSLIFIFAFTAKVSATPVSVSNHSFEDDLIAEGSWNYDIGAWDDSSGAGAWDPDDTIAYFNSPTMPDGEQVAYINSGSIWQVLSETLTAGTTYTLQVDVGWRNDQSMPAYDILLYDASGILASSSPTLTQGEWVTATVSYTSPVTSSNYLRIKMIRTGGQQVNFDNVSLDAAPVPEPTTIFLLGFGLIGLAVFRRRFMN